jgi:hypothetical protein
MAAAVQDATMDNKPMRTTLRRLSSLKKDMGRAGS